MARASRKKARRRCAKPSNWATLLHEPGLSQVESSPHAMPRFPQAAISSLRYATGKEILPPRNYTMLVTSVSVVLFAVVTAVVLQHGITQQHIRGTNEIATMVLDRVLTDDSSLDTLPNQFRTALIRPPLIENQGSQIFPPASPVVAQDQPGSEKDDADETEGTDSRDDSSNDQTPSPASNNSRHPLTAAHVFMIH